MSISNFSDFVAHTGPAILTSPEKIVNDAVNTTYLLSKLMTGKPMRELIQGGQTIDDVIKFTGNSSYSTYAAGESFTPTNKQTDTTISVPWRFSKAFYTITDEESVLNGGNQELTGQARFHRYKRIQASKEQGAWTDMFNGMEDDLMAVPDNSEMEAAGGKKPYSIFSLISPDTTNYHYSGFTTVQTIDPATQSGWRNVVSTYDHTQLSDQTSGLIAAFDDFFEDINYVPPTIGGRGSEHFEAESPMPAGFFITSKQGSKLYKQELRASNDRLVEPQDPAYNKPKYSGLEVCKIDNLTTAAVYTSAAEASGEPRYYFIDPRYLKVVIHQQRFFTQLPPKDDVNTPFTKVVYFNTYWNLFMRSRKRHGVIAPASPTN